MQNRSESLRWAGGRFVHHRQARGGSNAAVGWLELWTGSNALLDRLSRCLSITIKLYSLQVIDARSTQRHAFRSRRPD